MQTTQSAAHEAPPSHLAPHTTQTEVLDAPLAMLLDNIRRADGKVTRATLPHLLELLPVATASPSLSASTHATLGSALQLIDTLGLLASTPPQTLRAAYSLPACDAAVDFAGPALRTLRLHPGLARDDLNATLAAAARSCPALDTLAFHDGTVIDQETLAALGRLPRLATLEISAPSPPTVEALMQHFSALNDLTLRHTDSDVLPSVQALLVKRTAGLSAGGVALKRFVLHFVLAQHDARNVESETADAEAVIEEFVRFLQRHGKDITKHVKCLGLGKSSVLPVEFRITPEIAGRILPGPSSILDVWSSEQCDLFQTRYEQWAIDPSGTVQAQPLLHSVEEVLESAINNQEQSLTNVHTLVVGANASENAFAELTNVQLRMFNCIIHSAWPSLQRLRLQYGANWPVRHKSEKSVLNCLDLISNVLRNAPSVHTLEMFVSLMGMLNFREDKGSFHLFCGQLHIIRLVVRSHRDGSEEDRREHSVWRDTKFFEKLPELLGIVRAHAPHLECILLEDEIDDQPQMSRHSVTEASWQRALDAVASFEMVRPEVDISTVRQTMASM